MAAERAQGGPVLPRGLPTGGLGPGPPAGGRRGPQLPAGRTRGGCGSAPAPLPGPSRRKRRLPGSAGGPGRALGSRRAQSRHGPRPPRSGPAPSRPQPLAAGRSRESFSAASLGESSRGQPRRSLTGLGAPAGRRGRGLGGAGRGGARRVGWGPRAARGEGAGAEGSCLPAATGSPAPPPAGQCFWQRLSRPPPPQADEGARRGSSGVSSVVQRGLRPQNGLCTDFLSQPGRAAACSSHLWA